MTLDYIFRPRSIAVVGASDGTFNAATNIFLDNLRHFGYKGKIYPVNPKSKEILGLKAFSSIHDIPGPVDHVICGIPATSTHQLLKDCIEKKVRTLHLYTAGFAEIGVEDRGKLQQKLADTACGTGLRIIGPNCMGIYCPASGISFCFDFPKEPGPVGFISQSGSYSLLVVRGAASRGVRFSKMVSYGNACDIDECDLLEYLADDNETEIIAAYIEGTKDGHRLQKVLARASASKPVIIIKKGGTKAGTRGASSHTGAMAGDDTVWDTLIKQAGAIRVEDLEEMIDLLVTFQFFPLPRGRNAVVIGLGGGPSVRSADECERGGLNLSPIPGEMVEELRRTAPTAGSMLRNPVDVGAYHIDWKPVIQTLTDWEESDMFIWQNATDIEPFREEGPLRQYCIDRRALFLKEFIEAGKPLAVVVHSAESRLSLETLNLTREMCVQHKVPLYTSVYRAALAITRYMDWHAKHKRKAR